MSPMHAAHNGARGAIVDLDAGAEQQLALGVLERISLYCFCALHQVGFLILFTEPGYGDEIYRRLAGEQRIAYFIGWLGLGLAFSGYLMDAHLLPKLGWPLAAAALFGLAGLLCVAGLVLIVGEYPQAPLLCYFFVVFVANYALRSFAFAAAELSSFFDALAAPTGIGGCITFVGWIVWIAITGKVYANETRALYYERSLCEPDAPACLAAAILYFAPFACGLLNAIIGAILHFLALASRPEHGDRSSYGLAAKVFGGAVFLTVGAMYIQAAISGVNAELANAVLLFALAGLIALTIVVGYTMGWQTVHAKAMAVPLLRKAAEAVGSDWARAMLLFGGWAPYAFFVALAALKQLLRCVFWLPRGVAEWNDPRTGIHVVRADWLTMPARRSLEHLRGWAWSSVLSKATYVGVFFMVMNVGFGKITNVGIAVLIDVLLRARVGLGVVIGVVLGVGLFLFMLPPVPGFAIYLMAAFLIPRFVNFYVGIAISTAVSLAIRICSGLFLQLLVGERMGGYVSVRSLIAINSSTTRAIRKILSTPGLSAAKVCILVGGPDWPTSVLTGILHLNPVSMVIGTLPVGFVIFAVTIAGACQLRRAEGGIWLSASSITLGIASAVTFVVLVASAYYIEETAEKHKDELDALPRDEEVEAADKEDEAKQAAFQRAIEWAPAPGWIKLNLVVALVLQILACYAAQFFGGRCFVSFAMTDSVEVTLGGDVGNLFLPLGKAVMVAFAVSSAQMILFGQWAKRRMRSFADPQSQQARVEDGGARSR